MKMLRAGKNRGKDACETARFLKGRRYKDHCIVTIFSNWKAKEEENKENVYYEYKRA